MSEGVLSEAEKEVAWKEIDGETAEKIMKEA